MARSSDELIPLRRCVHVTSATHVCSATESAPASATKVPADSTEAAPVDNVTQSNVALLASESVNERNVSVCEPAARDAPPDPRPTTPPLLAQMPAPGVESHHEPPQSQTTPPPADGDGDLRPAIPMLEEHDDSLNASQHAAVEAATTRRLTIVQGPPGTGKTMCAVATVVKWAKLGLKPLLATAEGDVAVDHLCEGLQRAGIRCVRVGCCQDSKT